MRAHHKTIESGRDTFVVTHFGEGQFSIQHSRRRLLRRGSRVKTYTGSMGMFSWRWTCPQNADGRVPYNFANRLSAVALECMSDQALDMTAEVTP